MNVILTIYSKFVITKLFVEWGCTFLRLAERLSLLSGR